MTPGVKLLAVLGLSCTLAGAVLLYLYVPQKKNIGNVNLFGDMAMRVEGPASSYDETAKWQAAAVAFLDRARLLSQIGFALIAVGSVLQIAAVCRS